MKINMSEKIVLKSIYSVLFFFF